MSAEQRLHEAMEKFVRDRIEEKGGMEGKLTNFNFNVFFSAHLDTGEENESLMGGHNILAPGLPEYSNPLKLMADEDTPMAMAVAVGLASVGEKILRDLAKNVTQLRELEAIREIVEETGGNA